MSAEAAEPPVRADVSALGDAEMPAEALDDWDSAQWKAYVADSVLTWQLGAGHHLSSVRAPSGA